MRRLAQESRPGQIIASGQIPRDTRPADPAPIVLK